MSKKNTPFDIFKLPISFKIDHTRVEEDFISMQKKYHPDIDVSDAQKSADISSAYHILKDDIRRGDEILRIFNIDQDSIQMPSNFFEEIFTITEQMSNCTMEESKATLESSRIDVLAFEEVTETNCKAFAVSFIKYKYTHKAYVNVYGS